METEGVGERSIHGGLFQVDMDFCSYCGTILPIPDYGSVITCVRCGNNFSLSDFEGLLSHRVIHFNKANTNKRTNDGGGDGTKKPAGPLVEDRKCSKCGHMGMTYSTMQTRSVDEGQTVFYNCPDCNNQEIEYS